MTLLGMILIWALFEISQRNEMQPRLASLKDAGEYLVKAGELFLVLIVLKACQKLPESLMRAEEFLPLIGLLLAFAYCRLRCKNEMYGLLSFASAWQLSTFQKLGTLALGVSVFVWLLEGLRFRAFFSPVPRIFQGLPLLWVQIFLVTLSFACLFPF